MSCISLISLNACVQETQHDALLRRSFIAKAEEDQSSIFDTNFDSKIDIERWYRGSGLTFEKLVLDFDGYWDVQGIRNTGGSFDIQHEYPKRKYSVNSHHIFYSSSYHPVDIEIIVRAHR